MAALPQPHESFEQPITALCSAMIALTTVVVVARFWIRLSLVKAQFAAHDWCILASWVFAMAFASISICRSKLQVGEATRDVNSEFTALKEFMKLSYAHELIYIVCVAVTKVAVLLLYLRIAAKRLLRKLIWTSIIFVGAFALLCLAVGIFQCAPIFKAWDPVGNITEHCLNGNACLLTHAGFDIFQDAVIYILPMKMLYELQVPLRQKIALVIIFALGGFVTITGVIRLAFIGSAMSNMRSVMSTAIMPFHIVIWSNIQCSVGVVCASLPHFKPFIDRYFPRLIGSRSRDSSKTVNASKGPVKPSMSAHSGFERQPESRDLDLECGDNYGIAHSTEEGYSYSVGADGLSRCGLKSSEEHLMVPEARYCENRICKSTTVTVGTTPRTEAPGGRQGLEGFI